MEEESAEKPALTLVPTKLTPPTAPTTLVDRSRLHWRLDAFVDDPNQRVALVSAPAGSGKSTLVSTWSAGRPEPIGWFQVDEADRDPVRFWTYLLASLSPAVPNTAAVPGAAVVAVAHDPETLIAHVVAALLEVTEPVVTVIDDFHLVSHPTIDEAIERLVELAPPNFRLVLCTRLDPGFRLARLRVGGQLTEIRANDLRFTSDEAERLLTDRAQVLELRHVEALCDRTEGWAAGLVLAGLSLSSTDDIDRFVADFQGDDRLVADYLTDEFLSTTTADDRRRLLETSLLEEMSGPLIDSVCNADDSTAWLRSTAETNQLLISLDRTGTWFRYHHLLRDMLRLEADADPSIDAAELHNRAGQWHLRSGELNRAVEHLLAAGDLQVAADVIADNATKLLNGGHLFTVLRYLDRLDDVIETHSGCCIVRGWTTFVAGRFAEAEIWLERAKQLDVDRVDTGLIAALGTMIHVAQGDVAAALTIADDSPEPTDPTHAMVMGGVRVWAGNFDEARPHLRRATEMAAAAPDDFAGAITPIFEAIIELESDNPDGARRTAAAAISFADEHSIGEAAQMALAHSVIGRTSTDPDVATASARRGVELARRSPENIMLAYALASAGDVLTANGEPDGATFLREARSVIDRCVDPGIVGGYLARVEGRHGQATPTRAPTVGLVEGLTDRETAVLRYLPSRLSQREIASELYVSLNTVKTHCKAIYRKLGVSDRKAAVQAAREQRVL